MKEIEDDTKKWKDSPYSWIGRERERVGEREGEREGGREIGFFR